MSEKMKNIPKLRFPEFANSGEWEEKSLSKMAEKVNSKNKNLEFNLVLTNSATDGIVSQRDYFDKDIANKNNLGGYYIVDINDFIYNPRISSNAAVGSLKRNKLSIGIMSPLYIIFRFKKGNLSFFEHYFETTHWHGYMRSIANMGVKFDRLNLNNEQFFNLPLPFPIENEQKKIADCLSSVDSLILAQSQKVELLKEHKKGLLQNLFPSEGESVPRLRFPEFVNDGEWEEKKIGDLLDYEQPTNYLVSDTNYNDSFEIPVLTAGKTFILGYTNETHGIFQNPLPVIIFDDFTTATQFVDFPFKAKSSAMKILKPKDDFGNIKIIFELIQTIEYQANEHKRYWISEYQNLEIKLPSPKEQQKIADCLSSIDEQIGSQTKKLQTLKQHKKALMQQLFPDSEAING